MAVYKYTHANAQRMVNTTVGNLYAFLKTAKADRIILRTSRVSGGWYDNEADANRAGFGIQRFIDEELEARHEFSECYLLIRR